MSPPCDGLGGMLEVSARAAAFADHAVGINFCDLHCVQLVYQHLLLLKQAHVQSVTCTSELRVDLYPCPVMQGSMMNWKRKVVGGAARRGNVHRSLMSHWGSMSLCCMSPSASSCMCFALGRTRGTSAMKGLRTCCSAWQAAC